MATMQDRQYLWPSGEPIVASIAQKRAGLVTLRPTNAIRRERVNAVLPPIGRQSRGPGCGVATSMSFDGPPVAQVFMERIMSLIRGNHAMICFQTGDPFSVDVNAHIDE